MGENELRIEDLWVRPQPDDGEEPEEIIRGLSLTVRSGELHVIMGPNGSGKTTLALALMGSERFEVTRGRVFLNGEEITPLPPEERALHGLFLAFQAPPEVGAVRFGALLREVLKIRGVERPDERIAEALERLRMPVEILQRETYLGFSGGERKRGEMAQLLLLKPQVAVLDEPDTGVDVDSLILVAEAIEWALQEQKTGIILITHYARILELLTSDYRVHVLKGSQLIAHGGPELARRIEEQGYNVIGG